MADAVVYTTLDGPDGPFHLAASERGVVAAGWELDDGVFRRDVERRIGAPVRPIAESIADDPARRVLDVARPVIRALLRGDPVDTTGIPIDLRDRPTFDRRVLGAVREIAWGQTASYGEIARRIGSPRAARAVGGALGRNPISMVIPCHRVVASDGTLGGYGGTGWLDRDQQLSRKEALLLREGVIVGRPTG